MPIYNGTDDRQFTEDISDSKLLKLADATVALVEESAISPHGFMSGKPIVSLCPDEPYADEVTISFCSGVLIAPDLIATAAHCLKGKRLENIKAVFNYMQREDYPSVEPSQIYGLTAASSGVPDSLSKDIALVRLDRPVSGKSAVQIYRGKPRADMRVSTVGHPLGMPQMMQENGKITRVSSNRSFFMTDLDNNWGQSGSPVFEAASGKLLGLMQGNLIPFRNHATGDLVFDKAAGCYRHRREATGTLQSSEQSVSKDNLEDYRSISDKNAPGLSMIAGSVVTCIAPMLDGGLAPKGQAVSPAKVQTGNNSVKNVSFDF